MSNWVATTESGTTWRMKEDILRIDSARSGVSVFKPWVMKVLSWEELTSWLAHGEMWDHIHNVEQYWEPVLGMSLYAAGREEWRISTPVVKIEFLPEEEDEDD